MIWLLLILLLSAIAAYVFREEIGSMLQRPEDRPFVQPETSDAITRAEIRSMVDSMLEPVRETVKAIGRETLAVADEADTMAQHAAEKANKAHTRADVLEGGIEVLRGRVDALDSAGWVSRAELDRVAGILFSLLGTTQVGNPQDRDWTGVVAVYRYDGLQRMAQVARDLREALNAWVRWHPDLPYLAIGFNSREGVIPGGGDLTLLGTRRRVTGKRGVYDWVGDVDRSEWVGEPRSPHTTEQGGDDG